MTATRTISSSTETITINYQQSLNKLSTILDKYQDCSDLLSCRILSWGVKALDEAIEHRDDPLAVIAHLAQEKIDFLAQQILISANGDTFTDPVIDKYGKTWERWQYKQFNNSTEELSPHLFAKDMLDWMHPHMTQKNTALVKSSNNLQESDLELLQNCPQFQDPMAQMLIKIIYNQMGFCAQRIYFQETIQEMAYRFPRVIDEALAKMQKMADEALALSNENAAVKEAIVQQKIEDIEKIYSETVKNLEDRMADEKKVYKASEEALEKKIADMDQTNVETAHALTDQLKKMDLEYQGSNEILNKQIVDLKEACDKHVTTLNSALTSTQEALTSAQENVSQLSTKVNQQDIKIQNFQIEHSRDQENLRRAWQRIRDLEGKSSCLLL